MKNHVAQESDAITKTEGEKDLQKKLESSKLMVTDEKQITKCLNDGRVRLASLCTIRIASTANLVQAFWTLQYIVLSC